jgi:hypothetical protein
MKNGAGKPGVGKPGHPADPCVVPHPPTGQGCGKGTGKEARPSSPIDEAEEGDLAGMEEVEFEDSADEDDGAAAIAPAPPPPQAAAAAATPLRIDPSPAVVKVVQQRPTLNSFDIEQLLARVHDS